VLPGRTDGPTVTRGRGFRHRQLPDCCIANCCSANILLSMTGLRCHRRQEDAGPGVACVLVNVSLFGRLRGYPVVWPRATSVSKSFETQRWLSSVELEPMR
jgi:hypothetical protein